MSIARLKLYRHSSPSKFDLVTCFETLEHLPDPTSGIAQIIECARRKHACLTMAEATMCSAARFVPTHFRWQ